MKVLCALLFFPSLGMSQFFGGVVYDPTNHAELVTQYVQQKLAYVQDHSQLLQVIRAAEQLKQDYEMFKYQFNPMANLKKYRRDFTSMASLRVLDRYGNLGQWQAVSNQGGDVSGAYDAATTPLQTYPLDNMSQDQVLRATNRAATVELQDGANKSALEIISEVRQLDADINQTLNQLRDDAQSDDPDLNTQTAIASKINNAMILMLREMHNQVQLQTAALEQQLIHSTASRQDLTSRINSEVSRRQKAIEGGPSTLAGAGTGFDGFRFKN